MSVENDILEFIKNMNDCWTKGIHASCLGGIVQSPFRKEAAMIYRPTHMRLVVVALILLGVVGGSPARLLGEEPSRTALLVAGGFKIDIAGVESADAVTAEVDPVEIEMRDVTESNDPTWRQFTNGAVRYGEARFTFRVSDSNFNKDLTEWVKDGLERGDEARKTISVVILDKKGRLGRRYTLLNCFPVRFAPTGGMYLVNRVCPRCPQSDNLAELTVQIGSIEIDDGSQADNRELDPDSGTGSVINADQIVRYRGFDVEIRNLDQASGDIDSSWGSVRGGALATEMVEATVGNDDGERRFTPGKQYVSDITMTGYMTSTRRDLMRWLNASLKGDTSKLRADVTITPKTVDGTPGPMHQYGDCMITRIEILWLTAGSAEPIKEKVTFRPTRRNDPN